MMSASMPREKCHALPFQRADHHRIRGITKWRFYANLTRARGAPHKVQPAAANDSDARSGCAAHTSDFLTFYTRHSFSRDLQIKIGCFTLKLSVTLVQSRRSVVGVVAKHTNPAVFRDFGNPVAFGLKRRHRIQVVSHNPRQRYMMPCWEKVCNKHKRFAATGNPYCLNVSVMPRNLYHGNAGNNLLFTLQQLPRAGFRNRLEIFSKVTPSVARCWIHGMFEFSTLHHVLGLTERRHHAITSKARVTPGMIEMQVGIDYQIDLIRKHTRPLK